MASFFEFSLDDSQDFNTFAGAVGRNQLNVKPDGTIEGLRTTQSNIENPQQSLTTFAVSDVMQGMATYKPEGFTYDAFNQTLSGDLGHLLESEGGANQIMGGRAPLLAYDILQTKGADDGIFTAVSSLANKAVGEATGLSSADPSSGSVGGKTAEGLVFPLAASKASVMAWGWCYASQSNCHHSYNAADIFAPTGTSVVAAVGGEFVSVKNKQSEYGSSVRIHADDGLWYYYTHMGFNTIKDWQVGQRIATGEQIGSIGTNAEAQGTPSHVHFDISPVDNGFSRGYGYADGPLLDPQPALIAAFNLLK